MADNRRVKWVSIALGLTLVGAALLGRGPQDEADTPEAYPTVGTEDVSLLVDLADDLSADERAAFLATLPYELTLNSIYSEEEGLYRVDLSPEAAQALIDRLAEDSHIEFVEPETDYSIEWTPDDPLYQFQWNFEQIGMQTGWNRATGRGAVVAIIDTGVAYRTDEAAGVRQVRDLDGFVRGYDFVSDDEFADDEHGHGTHVAGTVAQTTNNAYGPAGVAPGARIMPLRVLDRWGRGRTADIADAIRFAADNGANIINMSLGGPLPSRVMEDAVRYAYDRGVIVIAAAGNSRTSRPSYPAAYEHVLAVSATQPDGAPAFYTNFGKYVDIAAPGGNTRDSARGGIVQETISEGNPLTHEFASYQGTSMASPHVAGAAALLVSLGVQHPDRIEEILLSTANTDVPQYDRDHYGAGLLDVGSLTSRPLTHFQFPRGAIAMLTVLLGLGLAARRGREVRGTILPVVLLTALVSATGLALVTLIGSALGLSMGALAPFSAAVWQWPAILGLDWLTTNALWMSAIPILLLYVFFGGARGRVGTSLVVGIMLGLAAYLIGEAVAPFVDVAFIPGNGLSDRLWLGANGLIGLGLAQLALRKE